MLIEEFFPEVFADLAPLLEAFPPVERPRLPAGLEGLAAEPLTNSVATAVPWEYVGAASSRLRGSDQPPRRVLLTGVTVAHGELFRRYVDWAAVWAQLGQSSGRGEQAETQHFLDPNGQEIDLSL